MLLSPHRSTFENWLEQSNNVERIDTASFGRLATYLSSEIDCDSFAVSPAYYALTGRRGLWLYHYDDTFIPFCWHPNIDDQILIFPPRGEKNYAAITAFLNEAPEPQAGFLLARFKPQETSQLKTPYTFVRQPSFTPVEEKVLDWKHPVRILSTLDTARLRGHEYMTIRNRIQQAQKHTIDICPLTSEHLSQAEALAHRWAGRQAQRTEEILQSIAPYKEILRLTKHSDLGLQGLAFIINQRLEAVTLWDTSNPHYKIANLYMNLCNIDYRGLSEFTIKVTAAKLCEAGIPLLNLGGSETVGLDRYKSKFAPVINVQLCSLEASIDNIPHLANTAYSASAKTAKVA